MYYVPYILLLSYLIMRFLTTSASTYGGNPLACAAGLAVAACFDSDDLVGNAYARGEQLRALLRGIQSRHPEVVSDVRGWGLMCGLQLSDKLSILASEVTKELSAAGVLVVPAGPKVVRFVPPLIVTAEEVDTVAGRLEQAIVKVLSAAKK